MPSPATLQATSMADSIPGQKTSRDLSIGLVLVAFDFNGMLLGLAAAQAVFYAQRYWRGDRLFLRVLVPVAVCLEVLHFILFCMSVYDITVTSRFFVGFRELPWMSSAQIIVNSTAVATIQSYVYPALNIDAANFSSADLPRDFTYTVSGHKSSPLGFPCERPVLLVHVQDLLSVLELQGVLVVGCWGIGLALMLTVLSPKDINTFFTLQRISTALNATIAVSDVLITLALSVLLLRSQIEGTRSQKLVKRLVLYTINTGALTSLCALLSLLTNVLVGETEFYILFYYIGTRQTVQPKQNPAIGAWIVTLFVLIASLLMARIIRVRPLRPFMQTHSLRRNFRSHLEPLPPPPPPGGKEKGTALSPYEDGAGGPSEHFIHARIPIPSTRVPKQ
ncbi:hypothetical protein C8Q74DRAFT_1372770 [Fomes fomentarius]|nr:hypothetical protein C8Q74DRAFT_1372770 [Fomes fomentarius]